MVKTSAPKKAPIYILDDPIKSTLFGKFYEKIILGWFKEKLVNIPLDGKPTIYWENVDFAPENSELAKKLNSALRKKKTVNIVRLMV